MKQKRYKLYTSEKVNGEYILMCFAYTWKGIYAKQWLNMQPSKEVHFVEVDGVIHDGIHEYKRVGEHGVKKGKKLSKKDTLL